MIKHLTTVTYSSWIIPWLKVQSLRGKSRGLLSHYYFYSWLLSFLSYFKTLSIGPAPGIEPATSRFAFTRSTDWANTAAVKASLKKQPALRRQYCFPHKMTSEKRAQNFHTGYLLLPRSGNASDLLKQICLTARPIRSNTQITTHNPLNHSNEGLALEISSSQLKFTLMTYRRTIHSIGWLGGRYVNTVFGKGHVLSSSGIG